MALPADAAQRGYFREVMVQGFRCIVKGTFKDTWSPLPTRPSACPSARRPPAGASARRASSLPPGAGGGALQEEERAPVARNRRRGGPRGMGSFLKEVFNRLGVARRASAPRGYGEADHRRSVPQRWSMRWRLCEDAYRRRLASRSLRDGSRVNTERRWKTGGARAREREGERGRGENSDAAGAPLEQAEDVALPHGALDVADDRAVRVVDELDADLGHVTRVARAAQDAVDLRWAEP